MKPNLKRSDAAKVSHQRRKFGALAKKVFRGRDRGQKIEMAKK